LKLAAVTSAAAFALALAAAPQAQAQSTYYPVFCQGIAVGSGGNSMFLSSGFYHALNAPPEGYLIPDATLTADFAKAVKAQTGETVLGQTCYTRADRKELEEFIATTRASNGSNWKLVDVTWMPTGAYPLTANIAELQAGGGSPARAVSAPALQAAPAAAAAARSAEAERVAAELREREQAERAAAAAQAEAERRLAIAKADEELRAVNAQQAQMAEAQLRKNAEEQRIFEEKQRVYEERQRAFAAAEAKYQAEVRAAAEARRKWEADVAACQAGDTSRCAPAPQP
jgi:flagellar biosynthesis GTPase FlhF